VEVMILSHKTTFHNEKRTKTEEKLYYVTQKGFVVFVVITFADKEHSGEQ
jgi:hypothetical protein